MGDKNSYFYSIYEKSVLPIFIKDKRPNDRFSPKKRCEAYISVLLTILKKTLLKKIVKFFKTNSNFVKKITNNFCNFLKLL